MITPELKTDLTRLALLGAFRPRMLMLGAQECVGCSSATAREYFAPFVGDAYDELDLDGGDLLLDLNDDLIELAGRYGSVFNLGTLEHVWDAAAAWRNALRAVELGGTFVSHGPVGGWAGEDGALDHGVHMTTRAAILEYLEKNGFAVTGDWITQFRQRGKILWLVARRERDVDKFRPVYQVRGRNQSYRGEP